MNTIEANKITENGLLQVQTDYKIVEKEETRVLLKVIDECGRIHDAFGLMSFPLQQDIIDRAKMVQMMNQQIWKKLVRLYRYYHRHYGLLFDDGDWGEDNNEFSPNYRVQKAVENNLALICEHIESWEESSH